MRIVLYESSSLRYARRSGTHDMPGAGEVAIADPPAPCHVIRWPRIRHSFLSVPRAHGVCAVRPKNAVRGSTACSGGSMVKAAAAPRVAKAPAYQGFRRLVLEELVAFGPEGLSFAGRSAEVPRCFLRVRLFSSKWSRADYSALSANTTQPSRILGGGALRPELALRQ